MVVCGGGSLNLAVGSPSVHLHGTPFKCLTGQLVGTTSARLSFESAAYFRNALMETMMRLESEFAQCFQ